MCIYDSSSPVLFLVLKMHFGFQTVSAACPYNIFKMSFSPAIASQGVSPPPTLRCTALMPLVPVPWQCTVIWLTLPITWWRPVHTNSRDSFSLIMIHVNTLLHFLATPVSVPQPQLNKHGAQTHTHTPRPVTTTQQTGLKEQGRVWM